MGWDNMTDTPVEMCHCGKPLHYTDAAAEAFTRGMISQLGETTKIAVPVDGRVRVWEVQRHYIALHGVKAAELPSLGFPELDSVPDVKTFLEQDEVLEPVPGPLEPPYDDEALLAADEPLPPLSATTGASQPTELQPRSPMRSKPLVFGKRACKICLEEVPVNIYGEHTIGHGMADVVAKWEGGGPGFVKDLQEALKQAMDETEGYPEVQETIRASNQLIDILTRAMMAAQRKQN
jgi:hypothetical protein